MIHPVERLWRNKADDFPSTRVLKPVPAVTHSRQAFALSKSKRAFFTIFVVKDALSATTHRLLLPMVNVNGRS